MSKSVLAIVAIVVAVPAVFIAGMYSEARFLNLPATFVPIRAHEFIKSGKILSHSGNSIQVQTAEGVETIELQPGAQITEQTSVQADASALRPGAIVYVQTTLEGQQIITVIPL